MKISEFKKHLLEVNEINFNLTDGTMVPAHFHITEAGVTTKNFIDCGGVVRVEKYVSFQLWVAGDTDHRLTTSKLTNVIEIAESKFDLQDLEVEIEYQAQTIGRYDVNFGNNYFTLQPKYTNCLADDHCGIPESKRRMSLSSLTSIEASCCSNESKCC
jgi:hypothetical protein